jgi:hypothetical protein
MVWSPSLVWSRSATATGRALPCLLGTITPRSVAGDGHKISLPDMVVVWRAMVMPSGSPPMR